MNSRGPMIVQNPIRTDGKVQANLNVSQDGAGIDFNARCSVSGMPKSVVFYCHVERQNEGVKKSR